MDEHRLGRIRLLSARFHELQGLRVALATMLEAIDGSLSYWALRHAPGRPDFHHRDGFALTLEPPAGGC